LDITACGIESQQPLEARLLRSRPTSSAKFAKALNYCRSLGLILDKKVSEIVIYPNRFSKFAVNYR
jgi:hypothetical protein